MLLVLTWGKILGQNRFRKKKLFVLPVVVFCGTVYFSKKGLCLVLYYYYYYYYGVVPDSLVLSVYSHCWKLSLKDYWMKDFNG